MKPSRQPAVSHRIGENARFEGDLRFIGRLEIDGTVIGSILSGAAGGIDPASVADAAAAAATVAEPAAAVTSAGTIPAAAGVPMTDAGADASEVVVGVTGRVDGPIVAGTVVVSGQVHGSIRASVRLEVLAGGRVRGDLVYRDLQIQHGAVVEGALRSMDDGAVGLKLVASSRG